MIKKISSILLFLISLTSFATPQACPTAQPTSSTGFCASFKSAAECHCTSSGLPRGMCTNMKQLYNRMIAMFGSVQKACQFQHDTSTQECVDDWTCYRNGGVNSKGELCSSTGKSCE